MKYNHKHAKWLLKQIGYPVSGTSPVPEAHIVVDALNMLGAAVEKIEEGSK